MRCALVVSVLVALAVAASARAQQILVVDPLDGGKPVRCAVRWPGDEPAELMRWAPLVVVFAAATGDDAARRAIQSAGDDLEERGFRVVCPVREEGGKVAELAPLFAQLRQTFRIEQGGMHAAVGDDAAYAIEAVLAHRVEFQSFTAFGDAAKADLAAIRRLPARRVHTLATSDRAELAKHFEALHAERVATGSAGEVARALDDFHDAAANGDEDRYFAILPDDAVFLGTDGTERWTGAEFRAFALPYFARDVAWSYVCLRRHVVVEGGDTLAWFDETFDNEAYGECRGSGVMVKRDGRWVLRQYHLTVPVPNDLTRGVAARIRAFQDGRSPTAARTIVVVRHAEKADASADAALSDAGRARAKALAKALADVPFTAVYATNYTRTTQTVAPLCEARGLSHKVLPAKEVGALAGELGKLPPGATALVCGHSNTVPELLAALGVKEPVTIGDEEFDRLFVVTLEADGAGVRCLPMRYAGR